MCRICGRMLKCIFDSMPSRASLTTTRSFSNAIRTRPGICTNERATDFRLSGLAKKAEIGTYSKVQHIHKSNLHQAATTQQVISDTSSLDRTVLPPSLLDGNRDTVTTTATRNVIPREPVHSKPLVLSKSLQTLLPALCAQKTHYITAHIHRFPYLLQTGDTVRLPFHLKGVSAGDVLRLNRASVLGSRDYTLKAGTSSTEMYDQKRTGEPNYLDERLFEARARVVGVESGPMFVKEKTKRRNRKVKTVKSKHRYTVLKVMEVRVKDLGELMEEKGTVLLES